MLIDLQNKLKSLADSEQAKNLQRFFKTGEGDYGEGDVFLGIKVPVQRKIAEKYLAIDFDSLQKLIESEIHEHRFISLVILIDKYKEANEELKKEIYDFYLSNTQNINNWDLVDVSSHKIVGDFLLDKPRDILYELATSEDLWEKRISIVSTFAFIRKNDFEDSLRIAEILLNEEHDLLHKAVGWMLREVGKKDEEVLKNYLEIHYKKMPRTMLRYAIEKFPEDLRKKYLRGEI